MRIVLSSVLLVLAVTGCSGAGSDAAARTASASAASLTITTAAKSHVFHIEVARTEAQQERGLMFRSHLAPDQGMIFPMDPPRMASFWMKNTVIPLDMIFIRADGTIARIAAETVPYSLAPVSSGEPVAAVLEIAGGRAAELGINEDDKVVWTDKR
ncbi:DUF192 domain-containing protein [Sphingomonas sp. SUN039]|uniref:DUF192 domain-containing protein n=1 Tax=Sphingomonas sp. SUN039 TaxID=2937787 RepID=UPI002164524F|nr:DUF192 domain-containing protein [Sphingomonas sp. SUN039]UVO54215.1 DUF192 domain-containing protein [Sphingomonas sp. SUN039]